MKKFFATLLSLLLIVSTTSITNAQVDTNTITPSFIQTQAKQKEMLENLKTTRQALREEHLATLQQKREEFKQKLTEIKNERKKLLVEKIDARIQQINTNRTTTMKKTLDRLTTILDRVATKAGTLEKDPSAQATLTTAREKIAEAENSVASQAAKQYVITITDEESLGQAVRTTLSTLKTDLKTTHDAVVSAKNAVVAAIRTIVSAQSNADKTASEETATQ